MPFNALFTPTIPWKYLHLGKIIIINNINAFVSMQDDLFSITISQLIPTDHPFSLVGIDLIHRKDLWLNVWGVTKLRFIS